MPGGLVLITGGVRSGKSRLAERLAADAGGSVTYIATAEALDGEMKARIAVHRSVRPAHWTTVEEPLAVPEAVAARGTTGDAVIVDCLGMFVTNILMSQAPETAYRERCDQVLERVRRLAEAATRAPARVIVVSNEVGWGLVPDNVLGRVFRDVMGWANQILAEAAAQVFLTVAGIPVDVKALGRSGSAGAPEASERVGCRDV